jgi:hypothetical protein
MIQNVKWASWKAERICGVEGRSEQPTGEMNPTEELKHIEDWTAWKMEIMEIHFSLPAREPDWQPPWAGIRDFEQALDAFTDWEVSSALYLNLAAIALAGGKPPPEMPEVAGIALGLRLEEALEWIDGHWTRQGAPLPAPEPAHRGRVLEWLLTDYWEIRGRDRRMLRWLADEGVWPG